MPNQIIFSSKIPQYVVFDYNCFQKLSNCVKASTTEESCAVLIGQKKNSTKDQEKHFWEIRHIWQCCNIWGESNSRFNEIKKIIILLALYFDSCFDV